MNVKDLLSGLAATVLSLVFFLVLLEITLQIYTRVAIFYDVEMSRYGLEVKYASDDPNIGHEHTPGEEAYLMGVDVKINSDGFRDEEYPVERNDAYRFVILGDSLTFAWGVEKDAAFEAVMEAELNKKKPVEMINFGHGNYNTVQQVSLFKKKGLKYQPDHVVMFYFINDAEVTPQKSDLAWLGHFRSVTFLWSRLRGFLSRQEGLTFYDFYAGLYEDDQPGWIASQEAFLELKRITDEQGIKLQVVMLPELHDLTDYPFTDVYAKVEGFLTDNGIEVKDLTADFAGYEPPEELWVAPDDAHPNALAHGMIAEYALPFIEERMSAE